MPLKILVPDLWDAALCQLAQYVVDDIGVRRTSGDEDIHIKASLDNGDIDGAVTEAAKENAEAIEDVKVAAAEDDDEGVTGDFEVTKEEMSILRAELACEFPEDYTYLR